MQTSAAPRRPFAFATRIGLFIALFALIIVRQIVTAFLSPATVTGAVWRECLMWASAGALIIIIRRGERLFLISIVQGIEKVICGGGLWARRRTIYYLKLSMADALSAGDYMIINQ